MILCYHAVNPDWHDWLSIAPMDFERHAAWLSSRHTMHADALLDARARGASLRRPLAITFDDGFADLYTHALPIIQRFRLPVTIYLVAATLVEGQTVDWVDDPPANTTLETLTLEQIEEMAEAGVRFGSHTWSHPDLRDLDDAALDHELGRSREALGDLLGTPVTTLAYPRGLHNTMVRRAAHRAGYDFALSLPPGGPEPRDRYAVPRVGIGGSDSTRMLGVKSHPSSLRVRMSRGGALAGRLARLARGS